MRGNRKDNDKMFSENNIISSRQLGRLIIVESLCISTMTTTNLGVYFAGRDGFLCIIIAALLSIAYTTFIIFLCNKTEWRFFSTVRKKYGGGVLNFVSFIFMLKYLALAVLTTGLLVKLVRTWLLTEVHFIVILAAIILLVMYSVSRGFEARARMAECIYYLIVIPVILLIVLSAKGIDRYYITPIFMTGFKKIALGGIVMFLLFCPAEAILFSSENINVKDNKKQKKVIKSIYYNVIAVSIINLIVFVLNVGSESVSQISGNQLATLKLMGKVNVNSLFLERQDELYVAFYIFGIIMSIFFLMYMVNFMYQSIGTAKHHCKSINIVSSLVLLAIVFLAIAYYPTYNEVRLCSEKRIDIDNISYTDAIIFDISDGKYQTTLVFPDDGEKKSQTETFTTDKLYNLEEQYNKSCDKKLDYAHTQIVILTENVLKSDQMFQNIIQYLNDNKQIGRSVCICTINQQVPAFLEGTDQLSVSLGKYLNKMFHNNVDYGITTLNMVGKVKSGAEEACSLSIVGYNQERISYEGEFVVDSYGVVETYYKDLAGFIKLVEGREGFNIVIGSDFSYKVDDNHYSVKISRTDSDRIKVSIDYYGRMITNLDNQLTEDELNAVVQKVIEEKINGLLNAHNCDFLNIYKYIGASQKEIWKEYQNDKPKLYQKLDIKVVTHYTTS